LCHRFCFSATSSSALGPREVPSYIGRALPPVHPTACGSDYCSFEPQKWPKSLRALFMGLHQQNQKSRVIFSAPSSITRIAFSERVTNRQCNGDRTELYSHPHPETVFSFASERYQLFARPTLRVTFRPATNGAVPFRASSKPQAPLG
jgi:hypothetical protein